MAKIPLRAYVKEIENLIERGEIEQAVAHAKNILKSYPKHIETYRLLGKAYLESQRYAEAADILQRVLSVVPDDFVSQIGMSIIREDEGNLDAAIWHMERAYEVQPFNPAVQDELRRLYGRRDGVEPPKIRLTRGALVRMYARGELYPQAIAETRAALAEDPQRVDLRVLLARLYYLSGHKNDAAEVCSELIGKLPFCYEANRLLTEILPSTSRAEEARKFQQRIFALDPYQAFISPTAPTSDQVPDQAVLVEQFTWESSMPDAQTPEWTRNVGVTWEETKEEELPDWLNTLKPETTASEETTAPEAPSGTGMLGFTEPSEQSAGGEAAAKDELIPDWMKEAGWQSSDRSADEIMKAQAQAEPEDMEAEEIKPAEIPDWLQSIAPPEAAQPDKQDEESAQWLDSILSKPGGDNGKGIDLSAASTNDPFANEISSDTLSTEETSIAQPADQSAEASDLPDWLAGFESGGTEETPPQVNEQPVTSSEASETQDLPDWFTQMQDEGTQGAGDETPAPVELGSDSDWSAFEDQTLTLPTDESQPGEVAQPESELLSGEETPDWLKSFETETIQPAPETLNTPAVEEVVSEEELPDWLKALKEQHPAETSPAPEVASTLETGEAAPGQPEVEPEAAAETSMPDFSDTDATMAWLESLAAKQGADEATLITPPEQRTEKPPEWVMKEMETPEAPAAEAENTSQPETLAEEPLPDWLAELHASQTAASSEIEQPVEPMEIGTPEIPEAPVEADALRTGDFPEFIEAADQAQSARTIEPTASIERSEPETTNAFAESTFIEETPASSTPEAAAETASFDLSDADAAMAWLESLAAKQGADEATLVTSPDQRTDTPPDWVMKEMETSETQAVDETTAEASPAELPEWLQQESGEETKVEAPATAEVEHEAYTEVEEEMTWQASPAQPEAIQTEETPQTGVGIESEAVEPTQPVKVTPSGSETRLTELPASTAEEVSQIESIQTTSELESSAAPETGMPDFNDMDAAMAWLESLAAKQGADEATLVTPPEQRTETPPDWVTKEMDTQAEAQAGEAETTPTANEPLEAVEKAEIPDWLAEITPAEEPGQTEAEDQNSPVAEVEPQPDQTPVSQFAETGEDKFEVAQEAEPRSQEPQPAEISSEPASEMNMDDAFAWLESLAAKQGAQEGTLITSAEERQDTPPEWVQKEQMAEQPDVEPISPEDETLVQSEVKMQEPTTEEEAEAPAADTVVSPSDDVPAWLESLYQEEPTTTQSPTEGQMFENLSATEETKPLTEGQGTPWGAEMNVSVEGEELPDWLKNVGDEDQSAFTPTLGDNMPEWLTGLEDESETETQQSDTQMPTGSNDFRSAWAPEVEMNQPPIEDLHRVDRETLPVSKPGSPAPLSDLQEALKRGDLERALQGYGRYIENGEHMDETIHDLRDALYRYPVDISIWQTLGDAYARNNQLQEALDAYTKAEELLR